MSEPDKHLSQDVCPFWLADFLDNPFRRLSQKPEKIFLGLVHSGQTVADLGCGPGYFTLGLARIVGENGRVIAVDLQEKMLERVASKAERAGLLPRITLHHCAPDRIGLSQPVDFALAFWMLHEVPDPDSFLKEVQVMLKPGGKFLLVEPVVHVTQAKFTSTVEKACATGLIAIEEPKISISRAMLFQRPVNEPEGK
jgi:ubiquinone/menaquinone biosynthesis C-methylase UbiE